MIIEAARAPGRRQAVDQLRQAQRALRRAGQIVLVDVEGWDGESERTEDAKFTFTGAPRPDAPQDRQGEEISASVAPTGEAGPGDSLPPSSGFGGGATGGPSGSGGGAVRATGAGGGAGIWVGAAKPGSTNSW